MCFSIYSGNWKTGERWPRLSCPVARMKVWHTPTPRKFEFYRAISGAEYFAVEAETAEEALKILEDAENPDEFQVDTIFQPDDEATFEHDPSINPKKEVSK